MSSTGSGAWPPNFMLTPQQQSLLFAAIDSNKQQLPGSSSSIGLNPNSLQKSPQSATSAYQESPFLDNYDYDVGDSSFDFSFADGQTMIDDLPETAKSDSTGDNDGSENNEKRSHPEDDEDEDGNDAKRRESTDRAPKKPGRKPLTSEPTSVCIYISTQYSTRDFKNHSLTQLVIETEGPKPSCSASFPRTQGKAFEGPGDQGGRTRESFGGCESRKQQVASSG